MPATGERERLSFDDAQILRLESESIKGHTGKVLVVAPGPGGEPLQAADLRARVAERLGPLTRLRRRVQIPRFGRPSWVEAEEVDLEWHVADDGPDTLGPEELRLRIGLILSERLDHSRPLWRLDLLRTDAGATAIVGRLHHAMADGVSAMALAGELLFDEPEAEHRRDAQGGPSVPQGSHPPPPPEPGRVREMLNVPGAIARELRPGADTPLDRHIGPRREVARAVFPLGRIKAIGHAAGDGVTVNDVVLAGVAGALRSWLDDDAPASIKAQIPVCLHLRTKEREIGNRDSFLNVDLPLGEPDAMRRLRLISDETSVRKLDHDAQTLYSFFHAVGRFRPIYRGITRLTSGPREFALSVSNVPGPRDRPRILGREISEFVSFAEPADRHALRISVISLGDALAFGLCSDPDAIGGLDRLAAELERSMAELESATASAGTS